VRTSARIRSRVAGPPAGIQLAAARIGTGVFVFDLSYVSHPWSGLSNGTPIFPQSKADPAGIACASPCAHRTRCEKLELITLRCKQRSGIISGGALCRVAAVSACRSVHSCWITAHKTSRAPPRRPPNHSFREVYVLSINVARILRESHDPEQMVVSWNPGESGGPGH